MFLISPKTAIGKVLDTTLFRSRKNSFNEDC